MEGICELEEIDGEEWVVFNKRFNQKLIPDILEFLSKHQKIKFGDDFNQLVDNLPNFLTHLKFGWNFDQPVTYQTESSQNGKSPTLLPNSLTHLKFGKDFNQAVDNLPESLTHLELEQFSFNKPLNNLPNSIIKLTLVTSVGKYEINMK